MACLIALAVPCAAQLNQPLHTDGWILAAAHAPGMHGSIWRTDLWIYIETYNTGQVTLRFCQSGEDGRDAEDFVIDTSDGHRVLYFEDVVDHFLGIGDGSWTGAIHYTGAPSVQVWARVYSISADGSESYGQLVEGIPTAHMSPDNDPWSSPDQQWLYAMKHTADDRYRVNIGIVNPTETQATYILEIWDATGTSMDGGDHLFVDVPPMSMVQVGDPFADANGGEWSSCQLRVSCMTDGGGTFAYASVVDNATNDAFFVRGVKDYEQWEMPGLNCTGHTDGWILAAAHAPGMHGSIWRTDLWIKADSITGEDIALYFNESGSDGTGSVAHEIPMTDGVEVYYFEDVVDHFLDLGGDSWVGAIQYQAGTHLQVWARVYSISADGTESYGQLVEGIPTVDASPAPPDNTSTKDYQWMFAARHTSDDRYRINLGVVNPSPVDGEYYANIYDASAGSIDAYIGPFTVPAFSLVQLGDVFATVNGGDWSQKIIRAEPVTEGTTAFAYLSVVDNATNDAYFVRGVKRWSYPEP
jgi:hypothetical protein